MGEEENLSFFAIFFYIGEVMKTKKFFYAILVLILIVNNFTSADNIRGINIDFVTIGNAGNVSDIVGSPSHCGAVSYNYRIGQYEVTNAQWNTFTTAAGAPTGTDGYNSGSAYDTSAHFTGAQQPTNDVSWYEAAQFCNYLTSGDKSKGAYLFSGSNATPGTFLSIDRTAAQATYGTIYVIPTEDEWYKAAYYKPDGSGYSLYANGTGIAPLTSESCYGQSAPYPGPWDVGSSKQEQNGTFDMMGNVNEWNEANTHFRGGSCGSDYLMLSSPHEHTDDPFFEGSAGGLRIAEIPEPATIILLTLGGLLLRKKK
jgi:formylglycine-generating enzyme